MAASYTEIIAQLDELEADVLNKKAEVENRQCVMKQEILQNIKDARWLITCINDKSQQTKDKKTLKELDALKKQLEDVIDSSEKVLKENI